MHSLLQRSRWIRLIPILLVTLVISGCSIGQTNITVSATDPTVSVPTVAPTTVRSTTAPPTRQPANPTPCPATMIGGKTPTIPTITLADLTKCRPDVVTTMRLFQSGNFPYDQDDAIFQNRERILPAAQSGSNYREYTVRTPGESTRGAHRLISYGSTGRKPSGYDILYYTDDHYETFFIVK